MGTTNVVAQDGFHVTLAQNVIICLALVLPAV